MTEAGPGHLSDEFLLLWQSGELPGEDRVWAAAHLKTCDSCRERLRETEAMLGELSAVSRQEDLQRFSTLLSSAGPSRGRPFRWQRPIWAAVPAAALVMGFVLWNSSVPTVSATELVNRAVREETQHPRRAARFHLRSADGACALPSLSTQASAEWTCERMRTRLQSADWDWENPLSARAFEHWRLSLADKQDIVTEHVGSTSLRTTTSRGVVRAATLELRNSDFHPVAARLEFDGAEQIEIAEDSGPEAMVAAKVEAPAAPQPVSTLPELPPTKLPEPDGAGALDAAEIQARVALHQAHADLGYETAVRREPQGVEVFGLVRDSARQAELSAALASIPSLDVRIKTYAEFETGDDSRFPRGEQGNTLPPLAGKWLKSTYPSLEASAAFVNRTVQNATALLGEAAVLEELTGRLAALSGNPASFALTIVQRDHQNRMASLVAALAADLEPLTGPLAQGSAIGSDQARVLLSAVTRCFSASRPAAGSLEAEIERIRSVYQDPR